MLQKENRARSKSVKPDGAYRFVCEEAGTPKE